MPIFCTLRTLRRCRLHSVYAAAGTEMSASGHQRIHAHRLHSVCAAADTRVMVVACQVPSNPAATTLRQALGSQPLAINEFVPIVCTSVRCGGPFRMISCQTPSNPTAALRSQPLAVNEEQKWSGMGLISVSVA